MMRSFPRSNVFFTTGGCLTRRARARANAVVEIGYVLSALPMELTWLEDYVALAESRSFSRAAEARHVTQPAFSRRIRALEAWVGTPLFKRTTHAVALTPAGEHFHDQAELLTRALHQLRRETLEAAGRGERHLSIAATHALSFTFFPRWVRGNDSLLALGNLKLVSETMRACEQSMLRGDVQFLLCHHHPDVASPFDGSRFRSIVVGSDVLVPLSAPGPDGSALWPLRGTRAARYLSYSEESGLHRIIAGRWGEVERSFAVETVFTSHLAATLLSMARAGHGVAWLPRTLAEDDIAAGRLIDAGDRDTSIAVEIRLFRPSARLSPTAEAVWSEFERAR